MRRGIEVRLGPGDRGRLEAVVGSRNCPQKHVWRARTALLSAAGIGTMAIQRQTGEANGQSAAGRARFMAEVLDGLLHEATRPAGKSPLPSGERTHWTGRGASALHRPSIQRSAPGSNGT